MPPATELSHDHRVQKLQQKLAELRAGNAAVLRTRLAHAHPWHVTRVARGVFLGLTIVCVSLLVGSMVLPLLLPDMALIMKDMEEAMPLPLPLLALFLALLMAVSWVTAGQAALAIARDCPLMPWEDQERRKLESELRNLTGGTTTIGVADDGPAFVTRDGTPPPLQMPSSRLVKQPETTAKVPAPGRFPSPVPTAGGTLRYEVRPTFPSNTIGSTGGTPRSTPGATSRAALAQRSSTPGGLMSRATPASQPPRGPSPGLSYRDPAGGTRATPQSVPRASSYSAADPPSDTGVVFDRRPHDSYTIGPSTLSDPISDTGARN